MEFAAPQHDTEIARLVGDRVAAACWLPGPSVPLPASLERQRQGLTHCAPKRQRDFVTGRLCAAHALAMLGAPDAPVERNEDRSPRWPPGYVGSITHTAQFAAALAARASDWLSVGLDAEGADAVSSDVRERVSTPRERQSIAALPADDQALAGALIFAAKEAFYKCQYPVTKRWLDFEDVELIGSPWGLLSGELVVSTVAGLDQPLSLPGRFAVRAGLVLAACRWPRAQ